MPLLRLDEPSEDPEVAEAHGLARREDDPDSDLVAFPRSKHDEDGPVRFVHHAGFPFFAYSDMYWC